MDTTPKDLKSLSDEERRQLFEEYLETGMEPYNAAIVAGYWESKAHELDAEVKAKRLFKYSMADIAEQEGFNPRRIIRHMMEKAGLKNGSPGVERELYVGKEALKVCVPDEYLRFRWFDALLELIGHKKPVSVGINASTDDEGKPRSFDITINVLQNNVVLQKPPEFAKDPNGE